jgi:hypothetical protein
MANKTLGAGKIYFSIEDENGNLTGSERYLAETPELTLTVSPERVEDFSADGPIAEKDLDIATKLSRELKFTLKDVSLDNMALFLIGSKATVTQSNTPVVGEAVGTAKQGEYMQLGTSLNAAGARGMTSITIKDDGVAATLNDDYTIDAAMGRIYIVPGGGIADGSVITADFTPASNTRSQMTTDQLGAKFGALRFVADNTTGTNFDYYWPRVALNPDGEMALKSRDTVAQMSFTAAINTRTGKAQVYIDGRPA